MDGSRIPKIAFEYIKLGVNSKSRDNYSAPEEANPLNISEVCKRYSLTADTLRYYERIELITPIARTHGGQRDYSEDDCDMIEFIKFMRGAGVQIEALTEYMRLFRQGDSTRAKRKEILIQERENVRARIAELKGTLKRLDKKIAGYETDLATVEDKLLANSKRNRHPSIS